MKLNRGCILFGMVFGKLPFAGNQKEI